MRLREIYVKFTRDLAIYAENVIMDCAERGRKKQMHQVFELQASMNAEESDKTTTKTENQNRNEENRRQIVDFIADNGISDAKTVSKAIGLKPSRTRDYLKQLVDEGILEVEGEYKSRKYKIKK